MNIFDLLATIVHDLLVFVTVMAALLVFLIGMIARLPADHPFRRILYALSLRVVAMIGAGAVAIPVEAVPGLDVVYDIAVPTALVWFWLTLIRQVLAILRESRRPRPVFRGHGAPDIIVEARPVFDDSRLPGPRDREPRRLPR